MIEEMQPPPGPGNAQQELRGTAWASVPSTGTCGCGCTRALQPLHHPIWVGRSLAGTQPPSGWVCGEGAEKTPSPPATPRALGTRLDWECRGNTERCPRGSHSALPPGGDTVRCPPGVTQSPAPGGDPEPCPGGDTEPCPGGDAERCPPGARGKLPPAPGRGAGQRLARNSPAALRCAGRISSNKS